MTLKSFYSPDIDYLYDVIRDSAEYKKINEIEKKRKGWLYSEILVFIKIIHFVGENNFPNYKVAIKEYLKIYESKK